MAEPYTSLGRFHDAHVRTAILGEVTSAPEPGGAGRVVVRSPIRRGGTAVVALGRPAPAGTTAALHDACGRLVRSVATPAGATRFEFGARTAAGDALPAGVYLLRLTEPGRAERSAKLVVGP